MDPTLVAIGVAVCLFVAVALPSRRKIAVSQPPAPAFSLTNETLARIAHEANRALCVAIGDPAPRPWGVLPLREKQCVIDGVAFVRANPNASPADSHENWVRFKMADGWKLGPKKDAIRKTHPCLVPYDQLPEHQRFKDHLFTAIVRAAG